MNDEDRRQWVMNDEGLYNMARRSGLSTTKWIRENRAFIDEVTGNVVSGKQPAHYLEYDHGFSCKCSRCQRGR